MSDTKTIKLDALDTLFFKDGKPFSMGEETWADGVFPPPPSVIYGALRTALMSSQMGKERLEDLINQTENLSIHHISYILGGQDEYYPLPFDVVTYKDKEPESEDYSVFPLFIQPTGLLSSRNNYSVFPVYNMDDDYTVENIKEGLISRSNLIKYLKGRQGNFKCKKWSDFLVEEPKVGIKRDRNTKTTSTDDGELYRVGMKRLKNQALLQVTFSNDGRPDLSDLGGPIRLGAEGKSADAYFSENTHSFKASMKTQKIRVYLATDGVFQNGIPDLSRWGISATLEGMATGKPYMLGGFDMAQRSPKPMLKVAPAGSVFYFKTEEPVDLSLFQGVALSDNINNTDYAKQGFGIAFMGTWETQN
jgi:CRISPR-associated protein Cmr3